MVSKREISKLWDRWAFAAVEVHLAWDVWRGATRDRELTAFLAYRAALDREEQAAAQLALAC